MRENSVQKNENFPKICFRRRVLGIDPGLAHTGFGVVDDFGFSIKTVAFGVIKTSAEKSCGERLLTIYSRLSEVLSKFNVDEAAMEKLYFAKNVTSALGVSEANGVVTLCLAQEKIPLWQYAPNQIKNSVSGIAKANKKTVENCVRVILGFSEKIKSDHASDALAVAITHINSNPLKLTNVH